MKREVPSRFADTARVELRALVGIIITLVTIAVILTAGLDITVDLRDDLQNCDAGLTYNSTDAQCHNTTSAAITNPTAIAFNGSQDGVLALAELGDKLPLIGTVLAMSAVIVAIFGFLAFRAQ